MKEPDLSLRQLTVFVAVAQTGSFTEAADQLFVSQSVLSRTVAAIERATGAVLFERDSRHLQLTSVGRELLAVAEKVLAAHSHGMWELSRYLEGMGGTVTVATMPSVAGVLLPPVAARFRRHHPDVVLRLLDGPAAGVVGEIANGNADLAIAAAESFAGHKVKISPLVKDRFIAIVPVGHRCSGTPWMTWAELAADPFITLEPDAGARALAEAAFAKAGMTAPSLIEARNVSTIAGLVAAGLGVCAMSAMVGRLMSFADVAMVPLVEPTVERELSIIEPAANTNNPAAQSFIEVLQTMRRNDVPLPLGVSWLPEAA